MTVLPVMTKCYVLYVWLQMMIHLMPINCMLCYVMLCYVMLCYVMLCYVMLCYVITIPLTKTNSTTDKANDKEIHAGL